MDPNTQGQANQQHQQNAQQGTKEWSGDWKLIAPGVTTPVATIDRERRVTILDDVKTEDIVHAFQYADKLASNWGTVRPAFIAALERKGINTRELAAGTLAEAGAGTSGYGGQSRR